MNKNKKIAKNAAVNDATATIKFVFTLRHCDAVKSMEQDRRSRVSFTPSPSCPPCHVPAIQNFQRDKETNFIVILL